MNKKIRELLLLAAVLVVLLGVWLGIRMLNERQKDRQAAEEEAAKIYVTDLENVDKISYDAGDGEYTFEKQEDGWVYMQDEDFPLKQSVPEELAETFGKLEAIRELKDGDEPEAYGLDEPDYTVELTQTDGNSTAIYFGNAVDDGYYVTIKDSDVVYTVSGTVLDQLQYSLDELAQFDAYPTIGSGNLKKETITEKGKTTTYDSENKDDTENIAAVAGGLGAVTLDTAENYSVTDEELAKYGLDKSSRITVEAVYTDDEEDKTLTLYIGNKDSDGNRYVMVNDSRIVYLISEQVCNNILNVDEEESAS